MYRAQVSNVYFKLRRIFTFLDISTFIASTPGHYAIISLHTWIVNPPLLHHPFMRVFKIAAQHCSSRYKNEAGGYRWEGKRWKTFGTLKGRRKFYKNVSSSTNGSGIWKTRIAVTSHLALSFFVCKKRARTSSLVIHSDVNRRWCGVNKRKEIRLWDRHIWKV